MSWNENKLNLKLFGCNSNSNWVVYVLIDLQYQNKKQRLDNKDECITSKSKEKI